MDRFFRNTLNVPCVQAPARAGALPRTAAADMPPPPRIPGSRPPPGASGSGGPQTPKAAWAPGTARFAVFFVKRLAHVRIVEDW